jgi:hypothetical protein
MMQLHHLRQRDRPLTEGGKRVADTMAAEWTRFSTGMNQLLTEVPEL